MSLTPLINFDILSEYVPNLVHNNEIHEENILSNSTPDQQKKQIGYESVENISTLSIQIDPCQTNNQTTPLP